MDKGQNWWREVDLVFVSSLRSGTSHANDVTTEEEREQNRECAKCHPVRIRDSVR